MGLAFLMKQFRIVSTLHAIATLIFGIPWVLTSPRKKDERTMYLCAYITGAEVLWRMTKSMVFWEYGKYVVVLIFILTAHRYLFSSLVAWVYFLLLIPSLLITFQLVPDFESFRQRVSFNLSGPLALMICYVCMSKFKLSGEQFRKIILALSVSLSGVAFLCSFNLYKVRQNITFTTDSNFAASGGFGPNQVSAVLGLGALLAFLYCLDPSRKKNVRNLLIIFGLWFAGQSALTFSRAGLAYALASIVMAGLFFIQNSKTRNRFLFFSVIVFLLGNFVLLPKFDQYTKGKLTERFNEHTTTGRTDIMKDELIMFNEHPVFGIGVGQAEFSRKLFHQGVASHTEFTRLLAEHGSFGILAILMMFLMAFNAIRKVKTKKGKAFAVALASWSLFFMVGNGMRLVAPSFIFGLSAVTILPDIFSQNTASKKEKIKPAFKSIMPNPPAIE